MTYWKQERYMHLSFVKFYFHKPCFCSGKGVFFFANLCKKVHNSANHWTDYIYLSLTASFSVTSNCRCRLPWLRSKATCIILFWCVTLTFHDQINSRWIQGPSGLFSPNLHFQHKNMLEKIKLCISVNSEHNNSELNVLFLFFNTRLVILFVSMQKRESYSYPKFRGNVIKIWHQTHWSE